VCRGIHSGRPRPAPHGPAGAQAFSASSALSGCAALRNMLSHAETQQLAALRRDLLGLQATGVVFPADSWPAKLLRPEPRCARPPAAGQAAAPGAPGGSSWPAKLLRPGRPCRQAAGASRPAPGPPRGRAHSRRACPARGSSSGQPLWHSLSRD